MNNPTASNYYNWCTDPFLQSRAEISGLPKIHFVTPAVSVVLAAGAILNPRVKELEFSGSDCLGYAQTIGLSEALAGQEPIGQTGLLQGSTYSRLTKLYNHAQVDMCDKVMSDLFHAQLDGDENERFVYDVVKVVGELHDNVPSHAKGAGFSAAQVYNPPQGGPRLEFAIADCGCGMLSNVAKFDRSISTHADAIEWCLIRNHTTAGKVDDWSQRVPDDFGIGGFADSIPTHSEENHHIGEGLWRLTELVRVAGGSAWIWTGDKALLIKENGDRVMQSMRCAWQGVVIELEFDVNKARSLFAGANKKASTETATRFGI